MTIWVLILLFFIHLVINATVTYITNIDVRIGKEGIKGFGVRWPRHQFAFKDFEINADVNVYGLSEDTTYLFSVTVLPSDRQEIASFIARTNCKTVCHAI
jgi:hypothetical protein